MSVITLEEGRGRRARRGEIRPIVMLFCDDSAATVRFIGGLGHDIFQQNASRDNNRGFHACVTSNLFSYSLCSSLGHRCFSIIGAETANTAVRIFLFSPIFRNAEITQDVSWDLLHTYSKDFRIRCERRNMNSFFFLEKSSNMWEATKVHCTLNGILSSGDLSPGRSPEGVGFFFPAKGDGSSLFVPTY